MSFEKVPLRQDSGFVGDGESSYFPLVQVGTIVDSEQAQAVYFNKGYSVLFLLDDFRMAGEGSSEPVYFTFIKPFPDENTLLVSTNNRAFLVQIDQKKIVRIEHEGYAINTPQALVTPNEYKAFCETGEWREPLPILVGNAMMVDEPGCQVFCFHKNKWSLDGMRNDDWSKPNYIAIETKNNNTFILSNPPVLQFHLTASKRMVCVQGQVPYLERDGEENVKEELAIDQEALDALVNSQNPNSVFQHHNKLLFFGDCLYIHYLE